MKNVFTKAGYEIHLNRIARQQGRIREAGREAGEEAGISHDWHDNFGYEDAKRRLELESETLERLLAEKVSAEIIVVNEKVDHVAIGSTVRAYVGDELKEYTIGGFGESMPEQGLVVYNSPIARFLIGMRPGDFKEARIGNRDLEIEVEAIFPPSFKYYSLVRQLGERELQQ